MTCIDMIFIGLYLALIDHLSYRAIADLIAYAFLLFVIINYYMILKHTGGYELINGDEENIQQNRHRDGENQAIDERTNLM